MYGHTQIPLKKSILMFLHVYIIGFSFIPSGKKIDNHTLIHVKFQLPNVGQLKEVECKDLNDKQGHRGEISVHPWEQ